MEPFAQGDEVLRRVDHLAANTTPKWWGYRWSSGCSPSLSVPADQTGIPVTPRLRERSVKTDFRADQSYGRVATSWRHSRGGQPSRRHLHPQVPANRLANQPLRYLEPQSACERRSSCCTGGSRTCRDQPCTVVSSAEPHQCRVLDVTRT